MKIKIFLITLFLIAAFLRLYKLGEVPNSYTPDEVAQAYTAYSILETGKDEWGNSNFLNLKSFGDYKPPIQTLLMIPSVKYFGLTPIAARLPNVILSILTIFLVFKLSQILFKNIQISIISTSIFALSPWSISLSRIALEANIVVFIITLATLLFLKYKEKSHLGLISLSSLLFGISLFTYHSAKVFTPLLIIILFIFTKLYRQKLPIIVFFAFFFLLFFLNYSTNNQSGSLRVNDIIILHPTDKWQSVADTQYEITQNGLPYLYTKIFNNKLTYLSKTFLNNYTSYLSSQFLLTSGAGETTYGMLPGFGVLGFIPFIGFLSSIVILIKNNKFKYKNQLLFLLTIILIAPLPASLAKGYLSGNRASLMMPFLQIFSGLGLFTIFNYLKNSKLFKPIIYLIGIVFIYNSLTFIQRYFFNANQILSHGMLYGHQQVNDYIKTQNAQKIIYSRRLSEPQAYVSFFQQIDPQITQKESINWLEFERQNRSFLDQLGEYKLDKFIFKEINFPSDSQQSNTILIGRPDEFLDIKPDKIIYYPSAVNKQPAIYIYHTKNNEVQ